ncbi:hypothetical protein KP509_03G025400 [Ceratopteris richardii]|uniref:Uncharacterized protein n=1 Tax=Ceratopteris richardii TaxID=49495 RepID=A0A8T2UY62_CERRI|nr:hypothetical protein KP509_03G025400 [Ceratopteris richardii]
MRLRERKKVNYGVDESDGEEEHAAAGRKSYASATIKNQDIDFSEDDDSTTHEEDKFSSGTDEKDSEVSSDHPKATKSMISKETDPSFDKVESNHDDEDEIESEYNSQSNHRQNRHMAGKKLRTRIDRTKKLNDSEDSSSRDSIRDSDTDEDLEAPLSDSSSPHCCKRRKGKTLDTSLNFPGYITEDEFRMEDCDASSFSVSPMPKYRRRLVKLVDRSNASSKYDMEKDSLCRSQEHPHASSFGTSDSGGGKGLNQGEHTSSDHVLVSSGETEMNFVVDTGNENEIKYLANVYVRRQRRRSKIREKCKSTAVVCKEPESPELRVDVFGLCIGGDEDNRPTVKKIGPVEKILSVKKKEMDSPIYCVKLSDKSYRNAVYVNESLLTKCYPQLLRHFWRRLTDLGREEGNVIEKEGSPAFNPAYVRVDRIIASEQRGRKRLFLVKWQGLSYSESTWEEEDALVYDKAAMKRFLQISSRGAPGSNTISFRDGRVLRGYQKEGVAWMDHNYRNSVNCILADEMGLGKTIQSVAMLQNLRVKWKVKGPFLVVAPVSTLGHWQREIESLTDMNCLVYAGSMDDRNVIKEYDFYTTSKSTDLKFNVLITGFEVLMKDHYFLSKQEWQYIIVDEAHRLKSKGSKTSRTLKEMSVKKGGLLLLTGTPVQNNTKEIFSLLNILDSDKFNSEEEFMEKYGDIKNVEQVRDLQENVLKPRLLRRMKEDVEKSIPLKEETIIWVELTKDQRNYYKAIYENRISDLLKGSQSSNIPNLRNVAMELRKLCNHPFLCDGLEEHLASKNGQKVQERQQGSGDILCQGSGKMLLLDKLLPMLKDAGRRVLIFSQFTLMLDLLEDYLNAKKYSYERIDGKIRGSDRQAAIDRYSATGSETFVFLLSTRAGGLGITLTAADTCVIYDSDWNPQNDLQAMARCHRIGQTKDVKIYRLITRNTYEQHLFECSSRKYGLDEAILGNFLGSNMETEHTKNIEILLKRGAYDMLKEDGEAEAAAFHAQNIDQILEQRTQQRVIGGRANNTFSVATFVSNVEAEPEDSHDSEKDPIANTDSSHFWQELLPEAYQLSLASEKPKAVISQGTRRRAQVNYKERKEFSDDEGSSEEEIKSESKKRTSASRRDRDFFVEDGLKQWTEKEVKRLETRLIMLGKGREEQLMIEAELEHHGISEVQQAVDVLVRLFQFFEEKERRSTIVKGTEVKNKESDILPTKFDGVSNQPQDLKKITDTLAQYAQDSDWPKIPPFIQKALTSPYFLLRIQKNASRYLQTLHERDVLANALSDPSFSMAPISRSKKLPHWWGDVEDLHLMKGALKHGHKEFSKIREDPSLCFSARLNALNSQQVSASEMETQRAEEHDYWPHDSVLFMRLKKIIECLPNGLSEREIKRRAAVAEAARKRWWLAKQSQEAIMPDTLQRGFIAYVDGIRYEQSELKPVSNNTGFYVTGVETISAEHNIYQPHGIHAISAEHYVHHPSGPILEQHVTSSQQTHSMDTLMPHAVYFKQQDVKQSFKLEEDARFSAQ